MTASQLALWPLSLVWGAVVKLRAWVYRRGIFGQCVLNGSVISVGNLTTGGTGKTPMVLWLMERLADEGKDAAVLTRGYGGFLQKRGSRQSGTIFRADDPPQGLPDEVSLLAQRLGSRQSTMPTAWLGVGADRCALGRELQQRGVRWFVLDDGFQHLQLARDADIVLVDAANPFGNGMLLPAGRLREPLAALKRADVVVITRSESAPTLEAVIARHSPVRIFYAQTRLEAIYRAGKPGEVPSDALSMGDLARERFFAFCGTGNPSAFFSDARRWGLNLCGEARYRDHHRYSAADAKAIKDQALAAQATALLCTEKDICSLNSSTFEGLPLYCARISLHLPEAEKFWCAVSDAVKRRRSGMDR